MDTAVDARTDRELVLGFRPEARVVTRTDPKSHPPTQYRVAYNPVPGSRERRPLGWCPSESLAWREACVMLGLRVRRRD